MRLLKAGEGEILDLAFSPDGRALAAVARYHGVFLWNLEAASPVPVRLAPEEGTYQGGLNFAPDERSVSWLAEGIRKVYDRETRQTVERSFLVTRQTNHVIQSATGKRVVSQHGFPDLCLRGWREEADEWIPTWRISAADFAVERPTLSADGRLLAMIVRSTVGNQQSKNARRVEVRDATTAEVSGVGEYPYPGYAEPILFSPNACQLVGFNRMSLLVWPVPNPGPLGPPHLIRNPDSRKEFTALAYHPSGHHLYATSNDETVHVFDATTWNRTARFTWQLGRLKAVAVSPDGTLAAAGGDKGDLVIWDVDG